MLRQLLRLAAAESGAETATLARALGVSLAQTAQMLETLERQGYLARSAAGCAQPCSACALHGACPSESGARLWLLTAKGARALGPVAGRPPA